MITRKLSSDMMAALQALAAPNSAPNWWQDLLNCWAPAGSAPKEKRKLRIAIRHNYLNFYHLGQSVAKVALGRGKQPYASVHGKYVASSFSGQKYARLSGANLVTLKGEDESQFAYAGTATFQQWSDASSEYAGAEKKGIEKIIQKNPNIIDLELGVPAWDEQASDTGREEGSRKFAPRMDLVALENAPDGSVRTAFWEAKTVRDSRLRSSDGNPKVLKQLRTYESYLSHEMRRNAALEACRDTCQIICDIHRMASELAGPNEMPPLGDLIQQVCQTREVATIDRIPRLLIFRAELPTGTETEPKGWEGHFDLLKLRVPVYYEKMPSNVRLDYRMLSTSVHAPNELTS